MYRNKCWFTFSLFCLFLTGIQGRSYSSAYDSHVEQHEQSVQTARKDVDQRLATSISTGASTNSDYVDCGLCTSVRLNKDQNAGHGYVNLNSGSHGSSSNYELNKNMQSRTNLISVPVSGGKSESFHESKYTRSQGGGTPIIIAPTGGSESYNHESEKYIRRQEAVPVILPSAGSEHYEHQRSNLIQRQEAVPVILPSAGSQHYEHQRSNLIQRQETVPVILPSAGSESFKHESEKYMQTQQSVPITFTPSGGSESYHRQSQRVVSSNSSPVYVQTPSLNLDVFGSTNRQRTYTNYPSIQYTPSAGSSSYEYNSKLVSNNQAPAISIVPTSHHSSSHSSELRSSNSASAFAPISLGGLSSSTSLNSGSLSSYNRGSLDEYMSESERLAKLQAHSVGSGGIRTGGSVVNSDFERNHLGVSSGTGAGGYRSQSWEKSSKWASGTEYGSDGRPKNYNHLSTAESEQRNVNGLQAGYKAATTTLDDDGKVSTYTIHT